MSNSCEINLPRHHQMISANQHMKDLLLQVQFNLCDKKIPSYDDDKKIDNNREQQIMRHISP